MPRLFSKANEDTASWLQVESEKRRLRLAVDQEALESASRPDGCYVLVSDLAAECIDAQAIHDRYKDLAHVGRGFRMSKTGHLELRPIYVRTKKSTRGYVFIVMLAYLIRRASNHSICLPAMMCNYRLYFQPENTCSRET